MGSQSGVSHSVVGSRAELRRGAAPLHATSGDCGFRGHAPDGHDRRWRGKNDDLDARNAAHAAFAGQRTVTPRRRDGMIESLRVLIACRKTAVSARRVVLQMIRNHDRLRPRRPAGSTPQPYPHATRSNVERLASRPDRLWRPGFCLSRWPQIRFPPDLERHDEQSR